MYIGPYEVLGELARGGMGVLYRARDPALEREVALKLLQDEQLSADDRRLQRFHTEARAASRVRHPNVVAVHGLGQHLGRPFLVMDLVDGESLAHRLRREGPLPPRQAVEVAARLARALEAAHAQDVVHRDVKADNVVMRPDGQPVLVDFGLARLADARSRFTHTGELLGTPHTMPPEQVEGDQAKVGPWSDVYSLGATLHELLAGRPPFQAASMVELLRKILEQPPEPLPPPIDPPLAETVRRCLEKRPEARPGAGRLAEALERWLAEHDPSPAAARRQTGAPGRWAPVFLGLAGLCALLVVGLGLSLRAARGERASLQAEVAELARETSQLRAVAAAQASLPAEGRSEARRHHELAAELLQAGRLEESRRELDLALELEPDRFLARIHRAYLAFMADDYDVAERDAARAIELDPGDARGWFWRGAIRVVLHSPSQALPDIERSLQLDPRSGQAWMYLGQARGMLGQEAEAEIAFTRAVELDANLAEAWAQRARIRAERGDAVAARADVERGLALAPDHPRCLYTSGYVALQVEGDPARCVRDVTRAFEHGLPQDPLHYLVRGAAYVQLGLEPAARSDLLRARETCPASDLYAPVRQQIEEQLAKLDGQR